MKPEKILLIFIYTYVVDPELVYFLRKKLPHQFLDDICNIWKENKVLYEKSFSKYFTLENGVFFAKRGIIVKEDVIEKYFEACARYQTYLL